MDVVYMVREGDQNPELRYSLRSLANLPHDRVWVVGYRPAWLSDAVEHVPVAQSDVKHENTWRIWRAISRFARIFDEFTLMNDDFFVLRPVDRVPARHAGSLDAWLGSLPAHSPTAKRMRATWDALSYVCRGPMLSWELHMPMVVDRRLLAEVMEYADMWRARNRSEPLCKRTLYGNYALLGGEQAPDCKIRDKTTVPTADQPLVSTLDGSFRYGKVGQWLRDRFPEPSPYESVRAHARI